VAGARSRKSPTRPVTSARRLATGMARRRPQGDASAIKDEVSTAPGVPNLFQRLLRKAGVLAIRKPKAMVAELIFLARSYSALRPLDILIISGGGQLLDSWDEIWGYPYTTFK
jgi:hypothetical protein